MAEAIGLTPEAPQNQATTDMCCFPGSTGQEMEGQCEDQLVYDNVCAKAPMCCDGTWHPQCASAYATYASSCANSPEAGAGSSGPGGGRGSFTPSDQLQTTHPSIEVQLHVDIEPRSEAVGGNLFLAGFDTIEEHTGRPARNVQPVHYTRLATFVQEWPYEGTFEVFTGLHYWAMYGTGEHPGPGDRMSELEEAKAEHKGQIFKILIGNEQTPAGSGGQPPAE
jgi:hypothetical protein